jgi:hypothetical protein
MKVNKDVLILKDNPLSMCYLLDFFTGTWNSSLHSISSHCIGDNNSRSIIPMLIESLITEIVTASVPYGQRNSQHPLPLKQHLVYF